MHILTFTFLAAVFFIVGGVTVWYVDARNINALHAEMKRMDKEYLANIRELVDEKCRIKNVYDTKIDKLTAYYEKQFKEYKITCDDILKKRAENQKKAMAEYKVKVVQIAAKKIDAIKAQCDAEHEKQLSECNEYWSFREGMMKQDGKLIIDNPKYDPNENTVAVLAGGGY